MKRHSLLTTAAAALIAAPALVSAESPQASVYTADEAAMATAAQKFSMEDGLFDALMASAGSQLLTSDGETLGLIETVEVTQQGFPTLIVDLVDATEIEADVMEVRVQPGSVSMKGEALFLDTSVDEIELQVASATVRDERNRVVVTLY